MHNESLLDQAYSFRKAMQQPCYTDDDDVLDLQYRLIREEWHEFHLAYTGEDISNDVVETLKELADLVFVCYQFAAARGWDLDTALRRVFESNMSKLVDGEPLRRIDGKILKGPNYIPPTLDDLV
jgi:predicted HAD superfamily Cof-like phosphohydrolase